MKMYEKGYFQLGPYGISPLSLWIPISVTYENRRPEAACGESCVGASKCMCSKCHCCTLCSSSCTDCPSKVKKSPDEEMGQLLGVEMSSEEDTAALRTALRV